MSLGRCGLVVTLLAVGAAPAYAQPEAKANGDDNQIVRALSQAQLEEFLRSQNIDVKKPGSPGTQGAPGTPGAPDTHEFEFKRGLFRMRLTSLGGKELMLAAQLPQALPFDKINDWNKQAKSSRLSLSFDKTGQPFSMLQSNLDLSAGVTRAAVRQFLARFEEECKSFEHLVRSMIPPPVPEKVYLPLPPEVLERTLRELKLDFKKVAQANGTTVYDFSRDGIELRLFNFEGKDLLIEAAFRKISLAAINKYNVDRKFVRAVLYEAGGVHSTVASSLDCTAGVSEEMLRYFINVFVPEAKDFARYVAANQ